MLTTTQKLISQYYHKNSFQQANGLKVNNVKNCIACFVERISTQDNMPSGAAKITQP